jgi:tetratricopeptide (TPR) repeat protein
LQLAGLLPLIEGDYANAEQYLEDGLTIARTAGDRSSIGDFLNALGAVYEGLGDHERAYKQLIEARDIGLETGNRNLVANAAGNLGRLLYQQAVYGEAKPYFEQALQLFREIGNAYGEATALYFLGFIDLHEQQLTQALSHLKTSIEVSTNIGAVTVTLIALCGLARLWAMQGQETRAVELLGSIFAHPASKSDIDIEKEGTAVLDSLQARMPDLEAAFERGKIYDFDEVIRDILTH